MTPLFDRREELGNEPGVHALIVGVSDYSNLAGYDDPAREQHWGMKKLGSAALSAYRIHQWLWSRRNNLAAPLASSRVLLSPSTGELEIEPQLATAPSGSRANFETVVEEWRGDAKKNKQNVMLFYFAGHGLQLRNRRQVLLMDGFGSNIGLKLRDGIDSEELFRGMRPSLNQPRISARQIYFFDACRTSFDMAYAQYDELRPVQFWQADYSPEDTRNAPLFYTCVPGGKAFGRAGESTIFSQALLQCLEGGAAESPDEANWQVTLSSLIAKLQDRIDALNTLYGSDQRVQVHGGDPKLILHSLDSAPEVEVEILIDPSVAKDHVGIRISDAEERIVRMHAKPLPETIRERLPGGHYELKALIDPPVPPYVARRGFFPASPPDRIGPRSWRLRVLP
jgi:hypothetical protein